MSKRSDIIEGIKASSSAKGLVYTCLAGWIDLGHARPNGARYLCNLISDEIGDTSKDGKGFKTTYSQSMKKYGFHKTVSTDYYIEKGLSKRQKESVALAIYLEVSMYFDAVQGSYPYKIFTDSGYSAEDLISNIVGFYRALNPHIDYISRLRPVSQKEALRIWDTYGSVGSNKNRFTGPYLYPCRECQEGVGFGPVCGLLPPWLTTIVPASKGTIFRDWDA